jgi:uncharacterized protein (DUF433 family)
MSTKKTKLIEQREGAGGVSSYVGRTRIRVADLVRKLPFIEEDDVVASIVSDFPQLTPEHVRAAFDYWLTHKREIDGLIQEEEELFKAHAGER